MNICYVVAIRIYPDKNLMPMADLKMIDGSMATIRWAYVDERKPFLPYINAYTYIYDEREKRTWDEW